VTAGFGQCAGAVLLPLGAEPDGHTPEAFDQLIRDGIQNRQVVKAFGITAE
jgi:hypothetical protein